MYPGGIKTGGEKEEVRRLFNVAKKSGKWTGYKRTLTDYNKALMQAKRE